MPKMSMCSCAINLRGDYRTQVIRDRFSPVSWPELLLLQISHGKNAVSDIKVVGDVTTNGVEEELRLKNIYGEVLYKTIYPLPKPSFEWQAPAEIPRDLDSTPKPRSTRRQADENPFAAQGA